MQCIAANTDLRQQAIIDDEKRKLTLIVTGISEQKGEKTSALLREWFDAMGLIFSYGSTNGAYARKGISGEARKIMR